MLVTKVGRLYMATDVIAGTGISDQELVLKFESLGDNCELGLVQRRVGVEPLGMFRFAGAPLRHLIRAMHARFEGMAIPDHVQVRPENGEYMVNLTKYDFVYHADVKVGQADPEVLQKQQVRTVGFLTRKLIDDLENPTKIMVFRQNEPVSANDLIDLRIALAGYGPATLLWVQAARPGHPPGSVVRIDDRLIVGHVSRLALREDVPDLDVASWLAMLRQAHAIHTGQGAPPVSDSGESRIVLTFGKDGNASAHTGYGWSAPENGFTWTVGERSLLTLGTPPTAAAGYWMEMDVAPFVAPPAVMAQVLRVTINGHAVHTFDPLSRGSVGCGVPGHVVQGSDKLEIVFEHPHAASPRAVAGEKDDRRLAVSFSRLSLAGRN